MEGRVDSDDAARALEEIDLIRRRVVNVVGHELRTPITTLCGLADQMVSAGEDELRGVLAPAVRRNARRVEQLLDDLLVAAEINTALPVGDREPVALAPSITAAWTRLGGEGGLTLSGDHAATVLAHAASVDRILAHLLDNARKYGELPVRVNLGRDGDRVIAEIHSSGEAPPQKELLLAFELFFRGERAVTTAPGLGIGLPVARALARHDGGDVAIAAADHGVVVRLELPAAP